MVVSRGLNTSQFGSSWPRSIGAGGRAEVGAGRGGGIEFLREEYIPEEVVLRDDSPEILLEKVGCAFAWGIGGGGSLGGDIKDGKRLCLDHRRVELRFVLGLDLSMLIRRSPDVKVDTDRNDEARGRSSGEPKWEIPFLHDSNSDSSMDILGT